jgi:hypothetical protein
VSSDRASLVMMFFSVVLSLTTQNSRAAILDQSFTQPGGASAFVNEAFAFVAQTYTAQLSGTLAGVSVDIDSVAGFPLRVTIRSVVNGLPGGDILGETILPMSSAGIGDIIVFDERIPQQNGVQYAISVDYPGEPGPAGLAHRWDGALGDPYDGGALAFSLDGENWFFDEPRVVDLHFRSFVNVVPEPSSLPAFLAGVAVAITAASSRLIARRD